MKVISLNAVRKDIADDIKRSFGDVFSRLHAEEESYLLKSADTRVYEPDEVIVEEDRRPDAIFVIEKGSVRVIRRSISDKRFEITHMTRGDIFGEMSFLDDAPASASVVAETEVQALCITESMIRALLRGDPGFGGRFYHSIALTLAARLRATTHWHIDFKPRADEDRRTWTERRRIEGQPPGEEDRREAERRSMADRRLNGHSEIKKD
jgi:CRP/FNR family transcriptional regulator, cyclic AMP receptor protein